MIDVPNRRKGAPFYDQRRLETKLLSVNYPISLGLDPRNYGNIDNDRERLYLSPAQNDLHIGQSIYSAIIVLPMQLSNRETFRLEVYGY